MKKRLTTLTFLIFFIFIFNLIPLKAEPIVRHSIKVGGDNHLPPYMYVNDNGIYKGFSIDIMNALAIELGIDFELHPMPWYIIPSAIDKGEIEVILGMNKSLGYSDIYEFSEPYLTISQGIFVRHDNKYIVNLEDLALVRVAVQKGNIPTKVLEYVDRESLIFVDNQQQGILLLMMGKIDAFVGDRLVGLYTIQKWRQTNFIKIVGDPIEPTEYSFAVKKDNKELIKLFNSGLKKIKANETYEKIYNKWFGEIIQTPTEVWKRIINKIIWGVILIAFIFLIILRGNQLLKKEVKKRTTELAEAYNLLKEHNIKIQKEHRLKEQILDSVFHGVVTFEKDGLISFSNTKAKNFLRLFGESEIIGLNFSQTALDKFLDTKHLLQALQQGKSHINQEKIVTIDGEEMVFGYSVYPLNDTGGEVSGAILSFRDITREKKLQENLMYKDKMQSLGQLVAVIAHEIRNPLMAIRTFVDLIPTKLEHKKFQQKFLQYVPKELDRLNQLVTDLLEYARPRPAEKEEFKVKILLDEVLVLFRKKLQEKNIILLTDINEDIVVYADKQQIKQILINLVLNSIQAIVKAGSLIITVRETEKGCIIEVTDTGAGIPKKYLGKVMDPFFTLKKDGSGLGLSICYQLVKEHGGEINISSKEKEGTTVSIFLPHRERKRNVG